MKKTVAFLLAAVLLLGFCACGNPYVSSYSAIGLVRNNTNRHCSASFQKLDGVCVFHLKKSDGGEGELYYNASLEEGEVNVYYDAYGTKELLFHLTAGESVEGSGGYIESGKRIYVIVETAETSKGSVRVSVEKEE